MRLIDNPFYILDVSTTDNRQTIISKAEEKSFFEDSSVCSEAQNILLNIIKRTSAELSWFLGADNLKIREICHSIKDNQPINLTGLDSIARLNGCIHNFSIEAEVDVYGVGYSVLEIDGLFEKLNAVSIAKEINNDRAQAGIKEISENEVSTGLQKIREYISRVITEKIQRFSDDQYVEFATLIAEKCIVDKEYNDGIVISDVIDQYEIKLYNLIENAGADIYRHIEKIKELIDEGEIERNVLLLIDQVRKWDTLVQPLQLRSMVSGVSHSESEEIGRALHEFSVWLHNEKELSNLSLHLIETIKPIFSEILDLSNMLDSDSHTLSNIISNNKKAETINKELDSLKSSADALKDHATSTRVEEFINEVKGANARIKQLPLSKEQIEQARERIYYIARDVAISLHNDKQQTDYALSIAEILFSLFGDADVRSQPLRDLSLLQSESLKKGGKVYQEWEKKRSDDAMRIGCWVFGVIVLIALLVSGLSQCGTGNSEPYVFSQSADSFDDVYVDIVSIEPMYSISTQGSYSATDVACRCETSTGNTVWVYMSVYEYNKYIDSSAKLGSSLSAEFDIVRYSSSKRIYGEARKAESLCDGLSLKTSTMILEFESIE